MRRTWHRTLIAVAGSFALGVVAWQVTGPSWARANTPAQATTTKWEYKLFVPPHPGRELASLIDSELNALGEEGWEVAGVWSDVRGSIPGGDRGGSIDSNSRILLKRVKK